MRVSLMVVLFVALVSTVLKGAPEEPVLFDGVVAHVNEHVITVADVLEIVAPVRQGLARRFRGEELQAKLREEFARATESAIEAKLILDAFEAEGGQLPEWAIDKRVEEIVHDKFGGDETNLKAALDSDGMLEDDWRQLIRERLVISSMRSAKVTANIRVSAQDVREAYDNEKENYRTSGKIRLRMIVLYGDKAVQGEDLLKTAGEIRDRIVSRGEDFSKLAAEVSHGTHAADGGDWGWVKPEMLRPELAKSVKGLKTGAVSDVISVDGDVYLLKVEEKTESSIVSFEDVQNEIESTLRRREGERLHSVWIKSLRRKSYVKVFDVDIF